MADQTVYSVLKNKVLTVPNLRVTEHWAYVTDYFEKNNHQKPLINIDIYDWDLDKARKVVFSELESATLQPKSASTYLYQVSNTIQATLEDDWISYQVLIGSKAAVVTPLDLIQSVVKTTGKDSDTSQVNSSTADDAWMLIAVCGHYRLAVSSDNPLYQNKLTRRLMELMDQAGYQGNTPPRRSSSFSTNKTFTALMAVLDMFWTKFKDDEYSTAQVGTLVSRFQDCTILGSINAVSKNIGLTPLEFMKWIFNSDVATEGGILIESTDELSKIDSYFPYLHGLKLTPKSPYSATTCPNLQYWIHFVGCTLNIPRSVNARLIEGTNISEIPRGAILLGYALKEVGTLTPYYGSNPEDIAAAVGTGEDEEEFTLGNSEPTRRDPLEWFDWFKGEGFRFNARMILYIRTIQNKPANIRPGTIGESFATYTF